MVIRASEFDHGIIDKLPVLNANKKKKASRSYINSVCAFDIEASRLRDIEQAFMYIWQFQIEDITVIGRTWEEFIAFTKGIEQQIGGRYWLVVYVHNLSYEFQFLKGIYPFSADEVFCTDSRKVLKCEMYGCIELRCSYYLTNMSLDRFLKKYDVENKKTTYNYDKVRYPWTELTDQELEYCINDVKGLVQALKKQMSSDGDDLQTVPMTSTGYVRRDARKAMQGYNYKELHGMMPDVEVYKLLREAFRGGDTLSNRWNTDEIIDNIRSVDIVSSYPASMLMDEYPMGKFYQENTGKFDQMIEAGTHALLFRIAFYNINVKDPAEGHLYLSRDKCRNIANGTFVNGRILCADYLETTLTDIDYEIVNRRYKYDKKIIGCLYSSMYKMLPSMFRNVIKEYYKVKTELKGCTEGSEEYYYYMKNKEKLNAAYGMTVQDIGRDEIRFIDGMFIEQDEPLADLLERNNKKAFLAYQWGVFVTARSRKRLADGIDIVTKNGTEPMNFIYSDTDSIKYVGNANFSEYNRRIEKQALNCGAYAADNSGEVHFMGQYEDEGYRIPNRFKTLGAKKYVLQDDKGELHITIAGVDKRKGAEELKTIDNFTEGFVFHEGGGTESVFNDNIDMTIEAEGHMLHISDNVVIRPSTYTLGITAEYRMVLDGLTKIRYSDTDIPGLYKVKN